MARIRHMPSVTCEVRFVSDGIFGGEVEKGGWGHVRPG